MIPALPTYSSWLPLYALLAGLMVGGNLYFVVRLFPRTGSRPTLATAILVLGLLLMSMGLWFSGIYAILSPGDASTVSVFIAVNSMMAVAGIWAISLLFRAGQKHLPPRGFLWPLTFALMIVGNELLMGATFVLAQVGPAAYAAHGWTGFAAVTGDAATSVWFFWAMLATMTFLVTWLPLTPSERTLLYGFAATSGVGPWVVSDPVVGAVGMGVVMTVTFAFLARRLWTGSRPTSGYLWAGFGVTAGFLAMVGGEALTYVMGGSIDAATPFGLSSFVVMTAEFLLLARWAWTDGATRPPNLAGAVARSSGTPSSTPPP